MAWEISEENKQMMSGFMTDFWKFIKASYEMPPDEPKAENDHYWSTIVKWADALSKKYKGDPVINGIILGYIDGQNLRSKGFDVTIEGGNE